MDYYDSAVTKTFLVSQKALIIEGQRFLLLMDAHRGKWELPGGLLEMDEDLVPGLKREVSEETRLEIVVGQPISICDAWVTGFKFRNGAVLDVRVIVVTHFCTIMSGSVEISDEHTDYRWAEKADLDKLDLAPDCSLALNAFLKQADI